MTTKRIPTNLRTLLIMEVIGKHGRAMTATEINAELGLPKQTVHRLVTTLEREGFLIRDEAGNRVRPSRRMREIGIGVQQTSQFHIVRHQILQEVAEHVRETVNYVVAEETGMYYLDRVETDWPFRIQLPRGSNVPFHCTASGKSFMASLGPTARKRFVSGLNMRSFTANTHVTEDSLLTELKAAAKCGYTLDREEFLDGMVAMSVPVTDAQGRFVAALAFHGPDTRIDLDQADELYPFMKSAAAKLSAAMVD